MVVRVTHCAALVLILSTAAPIEADDLVIKTMNWSYDDSMSITYLRVCSEKDLGKRNITLRVHTSEIKDIPGALDSDTKCAQFNESGAGKPLLPAGMTTYELIAEAVIRQDNGSVSFSLEGATITCGESQFLRFKLSNEGSINDTNCMLTDSLPSSACYVDGNVFSNDPVCFYGLDPKNPQLHVCVERTVFDHLDTPVDPFTADELKYDNGSFTFTYDSRNPSLAELLILSDDTQSSATVVSCDANTCNDANLVPSTASYNLCGVFVDAGVAVSSGEASFQDMDLKVDTVEPTVDFHFINKNDDGLYFVSGMNAEYESLLNLSLDCSHITQDTICNGFFSANEDLKNIAVSYADGTNTIITQVP